MKVYKVVRRKDGKLKSIVRRTRYASNIEEAQLFYSPDKETVPRFGKVFAFRYLKDAINFARRGWTKPEVWLSKAPDAEPIEVVASDGSHCLSVFRRFWLGRADGGTMEAPRGTVVCSSLTLLERKK